MKRTAIPRKVALKRGKKGGRFPKRRDPAFIAWIKMQPCTVTRVLTGWYIIGSGQLTEIARIEAAHLKTRGSGGYDRGNVVPLHWRLHREQEGRTAAFEKRYRVDLKVEAERLARLYEEQL